jgi:hypothetical protein
MRLAGVLSEPHTSGETQTLEALGASVSPDAFQSAAGLLSAVNGPACSIRELSNAHELSMLNPARFSLSATCATPQAAQPLWKGKNYFFMGGIVHSVAAYTRGEAWSALLLVLRECAGCARLLTHDVRALCRIHRKSLIQACTYPSSSQRLLVFRLRRTLQLPPSHELVEHTGGLGRLELCRLLRCVLLRIVGLLAL